MWKKKKNCQHLPNQNLPNNQNLTFKKKKSAFEKSFFQVESSETYALFENHFSKIKIN